MTQQTNRPQLTADASTPNRFFPELVTTMRDTLLVTYAVPVERARALLPTGFVPDVLPVADAGSGQIVPVAFAQCLYSRIENIRPPARWGSLASVSTLRMTMRLLVRHDQRPGAFLLQQFISDRTGNASLLPLRLLVQNMERARVTAHITGNPTLPLCETCHIETLTPTLRLTMSATQQQAESASSASVWSGYRDLLPFLTQRPNLYSAARRRDHIVHIQQTPIICNDASPNDVEAALNTAESETKTKSAQQAAFLPLHCTGARLPLFTQWFGLTEAEMQTPVSSYWQNTQAVRICAPCLRKMPTTP